MVVDVHSYPSRALPYELHADLPRPAICLGTDPFHTPAALRDAAREAFAGCGEPFDDVGENAPFAGCYVPLAYHGVSPAVSALMVEIRRDVYVDTPGGLDRLAAGSVPQLPPSEVQAALLGGVNVIVNFFDRVNIRGICLSYHAFFAPIIS